MTSISKYPSTIKLPDIPKHPDTILEFLASKFPYIGTEGWKQRIIDGKVLGNDKNPISIDAEYVPFKKVLYFREVSNEPVIPFKEEIIFENSDIIVACKPHFLPVVPGGKYVNECLLNRLRDKTGISDIAPLHRIDRMTSGIVMFSKRKETRGLYTKLFRQGKVEKTYLALATVTKGIKDTSWYIENRVVMGEPWFKMKVIEGKINARSKIKLDSVKSNIGRFILNPLTGKTHQLRIHMAGLGFQILNDRFYPELLPKIDDCFDKPLQLIAKSIKFQDPVLGDVMEFVSQRNLLCIKNLSD